MRNLYTSDFQFFLKDLTINGQMANDFLPVYHKLNKDLMLIEHWMKRLFNTD